MQIINGFNENVSKFPMSNTAQLHSTDDHGLRSFSPTSAPLQNISLIPSHPPPPSLSHSLSHTHTQTRCITIYMYVDAWVTECVQWRRQKF